MPVRHQDHCCVPMPATVLPGHFHQAIDLFRSEVFPLAQLLVLLAKRYCPVFSVWGRLWHRWNVQTNQRCLTRDCPIYGHNTDSLTHPLTWQPDFRLKGDSSSCARVGVFCLVYTPKVEPSRSYHFHLRGRVYWVPGLFPLICRVGFTHVIIELDGIEPRSLPDNHTGVAESVPCKLPIVILRK